MSKWIKHDGKGCPVPYDAVVQVKFRDTKNDAGLHPCEAHEYGGTGASFGGDWWVHQGGWYDITHYRTVTTRN